MTISYSNMATLPTLPGDGMGCVSACSVNSSELSLMEIEFLRLASNGLTSVQMSDELNRSPRTIDGYRDRILEKLNVFNTTHAVATALRRGIIQ